MMMNDDEDLEWENQIKSPASGNPPESSAEDNSLGEV